MNYRSAACLAAIIMLYAAPGAGAQTCASAAPYSASIDRAEKAAVLDSLYAYMGLTYVFPDKTEDIITEIAARFERGDYDAFSTTDDFAVALTNDLRDVSHDLHFAVVIRAPGSGAAYCSAVSRDSQTMREINYGFKTVQVMPGNVGYLELTACTDASLGGATASAAMKFLSGVDALIIDLRSNRGGLTSMGLYLSSYLFEPRKIMHSLARRDGKDLEHFRTATHVDGERLLDIPVYVLTSAVTGSSAESFAYDLKHHGRATIVGERTVGAGHCAESARFAFANFQAEFMVPVYQPVHPVTGKNWEGSGVIPDVAVASDDALDVAYRRALQRVRPDESVSMPGCGSDVASPTAWGNDRLTPPSLGPVTEPKYDSALFDEILSLYDEYDLVHIGERHWNMTDYYFRTALIRHPTFAEIVDDIVIESGNYLYQNVLDDYVLELKDVPDEVLRRVWRNTVIASGVWDATIYRDFIHAVRQVNRGLQRDKRIRLIAAEPPIDWSKANTAEEATYFFSQRSTHTPKVVESEVLNKGRKALIIYGGAHFYRSNNAAARCGTLRSNLEQRTNSRVFSILPLSGPEGPSFRFKKEAGVNNVPFFLRVAGSKLASLPGDLFFGEADGTLAEFTDGVLYFGTYPDQVAEQDPEAANDVAYQEELERRRGLIANCTPSR